jgi:hypothetical protein
MKQAGGQIPSQISAKTLTIDLVLKPIYPG